MWVSRPVLPRLPSRGVSLGKGYVELPDGYVLALVPPGKPRMPNGLEFHAPPPPSGTVVEIPRPSGHVWEPAAVPAFRLTISRSAVPAPLDPLMLAGCGPGLTPEGDDLLAGYAAGLVLWHGKSGEASTLAEAAAPLTTGLSAALLRHAAHGELPEPAHALLHAGDPGPLLAFGASSGRALLRGLALGCMAADANPNLSPLSLGDAALSRWG